MKGNGARYIGDVLLDMLSTNPGFIGTARELIAADWRTGSKSFREYVEPLLGEIFAVGGFMAWGDYDPGYLERRVMDDALDMHKDPWLWTYGALIGAHIPPVVARTALNGIEGRKGEG